MSKFVRILPKPPHCTESGWSIAPVSRKRKRARRRSYECPECHKCYSSTNALNIHERICLGNSADGLNICDYCLTLHAGPETLAAHTAAEHADGKFLCLSCAKRFASRGYLRNHMLLAHKQPTLKYRCMICTVHGEAGNFDSKRELCAHNRTTHCHLSVATDIQPVATKEPYCPITEICTHNNNNDDDDDEMEDLEWLDDCLSLTFNGFDFGLDKVLNNVENNTFSELAAPAAPYVCPLCNCAADKAASLMKHVQGSHDADPLVCVYCRKPFDKLVNYKRHLERKHTLLPRHECFFCKLRFSSMDHLKKHVLGLHQNERSFFCDTCHAGFTQSVHLRQHLDTHTRRKRFACLACAKCFWRRIDLQRHRCSVPANTAKTLGGN